MTKDDIIRMAREAGIVMSLVRPCHPRKGASMTRDDIIRMAREAGFAVDAFPDAAWIALMGRFAALVAAQEREACKQWFIEDSERFAAQVALAEREACAKVCDARFVGDHNREDMEARRCAAAIRARGQEMERKPTNAHDKVYSEVELADAYQKGWNDAMLRSSLGMARGQA